MSAGYRCASALGENEEVFNLSRVAALALLLSAPISQAALCARDQVPAATLLLPWFEASTTCTASQDRNTVFTVSNTSAQSLLARVTLWSNAAVPVIGINVFMNGFGQESIDLRAVLSAQPSPSNGQCAGLPTFDSDLAVGHVTVDAVTACNLPLHGNAGFYAGVANENVLAGTAALTDFDMNFSASLPMLAIEAASSAQLANSSSF